jgi:DNA topoisomerase I
MAKNLVIVESPTKCRTISKYLGSDYAVKATMGHIMDLPERELGVDVEHDFAPKYRASKGKERILKMLTEEAKKAKIIYLGPDPDREGEAIAWHVAQLVSKVNPNTHRVMFNEVTKRAVLSAIDNAHDIDISKVNAQQARRILDRIVGYQVSPVLWKALYRGLSAGRVQSVALRLICEREEAIRAFKQQEYWTIEARLAHAGAAFTAVLAKIDGAKAALHNEGEARTVVDRLKGKPFVVHKVQRSEKTRKPYAPFITSTLQQDAARKLGFSASRTMTVAQQLYEGMELGELGTTGLITYMRTDSTRTADEALADARKVIAQLFDSRHVPKTSQKYGKSKSAQDAHEAIRPSQVSLDFAPEKVKPYLARDQYRLYELIWKRFLASQMANAVFDSTRVEIMADNCLFRVSGSVLKFDGFLALYEEGKDDAGENGERKSDRLPPLEPTTDLDVKGIDKRQHFTQPPPRYSEATLVRELEDKGIGRPSTYAQIIDTLRRRKYTLVEKRRFFPTELGEKVKDLLVHEFAHIFNVEFTAGMENELDKVEDGSVDWVTVLRQFYQPFQKRLGEVSSRLGDLKSRNQEATGRMCPSCNKAPLVVKWSRNGKFLACQGFPACRYTEPLEKDQPQQTDEVCDKCGAPMVILTMGANRFLGCSRYPDCRSTRSITTGVHCPNKGCEGMLVKRTSKRGRTFYGCNKYPTCTFACWDEPVDRACEKCGHPILVMRETKARGPYLRCPNCRVEYAAETEADAGDGAEEKRAAQ